MFTKFQFSYLFRSLFRLKTKIQMNESSLMKFDPTYHYRVIDLYPEKGFEYIHELHDPLDFSAKKIERESHIERFHSKSRLIKSEELKLLVFESLKDYFWTQINKRKIVILLPTSQGYSKKEYLSVDLNFDEENSRIITPLLPLRDLTKLIPLNSYANYNQYVFFLLKNWLKTFVRWSQDLTSTEFSVLHLLALLQGSAQSSFQFKDLSSDENEAILSKLPEIRYRIHQYQQNCRQRDCSFKCRSWNEPLFEDSNYHLKSNCSFIRFQVFEIEDSFMFAWRDYPNECPITSTCCFCQLVRYYNYDCYINCCKRKGVSVKKLFENLNFKLIISIESFLRRLKNAFKKQQNDPSKILGPQKNLNTIKYRGIKSTDGHKLDSKQELIIDELLFKNKIPHCVSKSWHASSIPFYGKTRFYPDFILEDCYLEVAGLKGTSLDEGKYDTKLERKLKLANYKGINLVILIPPRKNNGNWSLEGNYNSDTINSLGIF